MEERVPLYHLYEMQHAALGPFRAAADAGKLFFQNPLNPFAHTLLGKSIAAGCEVFERVTRRYGKPAWGIDTTTVDGENVAVHERVVWQRPFCNLIHFVRATKRTRHDPKLLLVAPMSGHYATLLRGTVEALLPEHDVYVTDWVDARMIPAGEGPFGLDEYVALMRRFITHLGADKLHVMSVCQPTVPVLAAVSLMASAGEATPRTLTLMGGPIDPRKAPTQVNDLATHKPFSWFETNVIFEVPPNYPGKGRRVYPGFLQHAGFVAMNPSRHFSAHWDFYQNLLRGDLEDADAHRRFYDEYNAVLDMPAEFYLDTIRIVFQEFALPRGQWHVDGVRVAPEAIKRSALLTIEGELDDISGIGQTRAAHDLCTGVPAKNRQHLEVKGAGHYGIFSGRRWREIVYPDVRDFIRRFDAK